MDEPRTQQPGSANATTILASRADLADAIGRVGIYERKALSPDQLAGLILAELDSAGLIHAELDGTVTAAAKQARLVREAAAIGTRHGTNAGRAAAEKGDRPDEDSPPSVFADDPDYTLANLASDLGLAEDDPMLDVAAIDGYVVAAAAAFWLRFDQGASEDDPPTCILTGEDGENPDDCTTHDHEGDEPR